MKKFLIAIAASLMIVPTQAQDNPDMGVHLSGGISWLFAGMKNKMFLYAAETSTTSYSLSCEVGTIEKGSKPGQFYITLPEDAPSFVTIYTNLDSAGVKVRVYTSGFVVMDAPRPSLFPLLGGAYGTIKKETILENPVITIVPFHDFFNLEWEQFTVSSFSLTMVVDNGDLITRTTKGNRFSAQMIEIITKMEKGQKFYLEDIEVVGDNGSHRKIKPMSVIIG